MPTLIQAAWPILSDLAATLFFVAIAAITHDPLIATAVALAVAAVQLVWTLARRKPVGALQWMSFGLVAVFGSASLLTHDPRFIMVKPSVIYVVVGVVMLKRGWMLRYIPERVREHVDEDAIVKWGYAWAALMFATAALNAGFAVATSFAIWSRFMVVFPPASKVLLFAAQYLSIRVGVRARMRAARIA
jgi:intracellular septation protein A